MAFNSSNLKRMAFDSDTDTAPSKFCLVPETFLFPCGGSDLVSQLVLVFPLACSDSLPPCPSPSPLFPGRNTAIQELAVRSAGFKHTLFFQRPPPNPWQCRNILVTNMVTPLGCLGVTFIFCFSPASHTFHFAAVHGDTEMCVMI